jgi:hypothetical protein
MQLTIEGFERLIGVGCITLYWGIKLLTFVVLHNFLVGFLDESEGFRLTV